MVNDEFLQELANDLAAHRGKRVEILRAKIPALASHGDAASTTSGRVVLSRQGGNGAAGLENVAISDSSIGVSPGAEASDSAAKRRRLGFLRNAAVSDLAGLLVAAGNFVPAWVLHGNPQLVTTAIGTTLLTIFGTKIANRMSKGGETA